MASTKTGISAKQLQRELGVTYKTAWRIFKEIRKLMVEDIKPLRGQVEVDETYIGGKHSGTPGRGAEGKTIVIGLAEREGKAIAKVATNVKAKTIIPMIWKNVAFNSTVYTDELPSYKLVPKLGYSHEVVQHAAKQYVVGNAHVNTVESLWSTIKRGIDGVNHSVSPQYLQSYLDSYIFRYNHRKDDQPMFQSLLERVPSLVEVERPF
jgi:transposase-like protein